MENNRYDNSPICVWSTSPVHAGIYLGRLPVFSFLGGSSARTVITPTASGCKARVLVTNKFGETPVTLDCVTIGNLMPNRKYSMNPGTVRELTFGGKPNVTLLPGESKYSDFVDFNIVAMRPVALNVYVSHLYRMATLGMYGCRTVLSPDDCTHSEKIYGTPLALKAKTVTMYGSAFFAALDTVPREEGYSVVLAGDSTLTNEMDHMLAEKLVGMGYDNIGICQQAIIGNRLLADGAGIIGNLYGDALLKRFSTDVLGCTGVKAVMVKCGFNDISHPNTRSMRKTAPFASTEEIIAGYRKLVQLSHDAGVRIYFFNIAPWKGYERKVFLPGMKPDITWSPDLQKLTDILNDWIETNTEADGFISDKCIRDKNDPLMIAGAYSPDSGHLNEAGQRVLVESIPKEFYL